MPSFYTAAALLEAHRLVTIVTTLDLPAELDRYRWATGEAWTAGALLAAVRLRG